MLQAIQHLLQNTASVSASLASWDFGNGALLPAIFTTAPAPAPCETPLITLSLQSTGNEAGTRGQRGQGIVITVRLWGNAGRSPKSLREIALSIWRTLDRAHIQPEDFQESFLRCSLPDFETDADGFPGYRLDVTTSLVEPRE